MDTIEKLGILADAAKYDVACTSSGVDRGAAAGRLGSAVSAGICHSFSADGRCIALLKVLFTNACAYDCAYCVNRRENDVPRVAFKPRELADLTIEFYRRNYIEGLFLSSGVLGCADRTMELTIETLGILREEYGFRGYIHAKAIPGASPELIARLGLLADRTSVNVELPSKESLALLCCASSESHSRAPVSSSRARGCIKARGSNTLPRPCGPAWSIPLGPKARAAGVETSRANFRSGTKRSSRVRAESSFLQR